MLFRKNVAKFCTYCKHAGQVGEDRMLCRKKGFVNGSDHCRAFRYDPLKRTPPRATAKDFSEFESTDFSL